MGFSLTCGLFCAIIMFWNAIELSDAGKKTYRIYTGNQENYRAVNVPFIYDSKHKEEHALIGAIFAFTVVELILAIWSAALCFIDDRQAQLSNVSWSNVNYKLFFNNNVAQCTKSSLSILPDKNKTKMWLDTIL